MAASGGIWAIDAGADSHRLLAWAIAVGEAHRVDRLLPKAVNMDDGSARPGFRAANVTMGFAPEIGGIPVAVRDFSRALGADVLDFYNQPIGPERHWVKGELRRLPCRRYWIQQTALYLPRASREAGAHWLSERHLWVGHGCFLPHLGLVRRLAEQRSTPYWAVPHGALDPYVFERNRLAKAVWMRLHGRRYFAGASRVLFATRREMEKAAPRCPGSRPEVIPWPVTPIDTSDRHARRKRFRERFNLPEKDRVLLFLGRIDRLKRPWETIVAFSRNAPAKATLLMVGMDGDLRGADLKERSQNLPGVRITGALFGPDKEDALLAADGYISLSHRENFGYAAAEAASAGLPSILSPGNDLGHDLPPSARWLLPDLTDPVLDGALSEFFRSSDEELKERGNSARDWAGRFLSPDRFGETLRRWAGEDTVRPGRARTAGI